jgi:hypothetical protein
MNLKTATFLAFIGSLFLLLGTLSLVTHQIFYIDQKIVFYIWAIGFLLLTIFFYSLYKNQK